MEGTKVCAVLLTMAVYTVAMPTNLNVNSGGRYMRLTKGREHRKPAHVCADSSCITIAAYLERRQPRVAAGTTPTDYPPFDNKATTSTLSESISLQTRRATEGEVALTGSSARVREGQDKVHFKEDGTSCKEADWHGMCFHGQCVQTYLIHENIDNSNENQDNNLCSEYQLKTTVNGALTTCSYWCSEGSTVYSVDVLDGTLCVDAEDAEGLCMDGKCDTKQQLTKAVIYKLRLRNPSEELVPGCTTQELSAEDVFAVSTSSPFSIAKSRTPSMQAGDTASRGNSTEQYRSISTATSEFRAVTSVRSRSAKYTLPPLTFTKAQAEDEHTLYSPNISSERGFFENPRAPSHAHYALTTATINTTAAPKQEVSAPYEQEKTESAPDLRTTRGPHIAGITNIEIKPLSNYSAVATIATPKSLQSSEQGAGNTVPTTNHVGLELYSTLNDISGQRQADTEPISAKTEPQSLPVGFTAAGVNFENSTTSTTDAIDRPVTTAKMVVPEHNGSQAPLTTHLTGMHHSGAASRSTPSIVPHQTRSAPTTVTSHPHTEANYKREKISEYMYQTTFTPSLSKISPSSKRGTETSGSRRATLERNTHQTTTTSDPGTGKRPTVTHVKDMQVVHTTTTKLEWPHYTRYPSRLPHVIFTDFFQKFATTGMPTRAALSEVAKRN